MAETVSEYSHSFIQDLISSGWEARAGGKLLEAREQLTEALEMARQHGGMAHEVAALQKLGHIEQDLGNEEGAHEIFEHLVTLTGAKGSRRYHAHALRHLGDSFVRRNELDAAEKLYTEAMYEYELLEGRDELSLANALRSMAILREKQGRRGDAAACWNKACHLYESEGIESGVDECISHLEKLSASR